MVCFSCGKSGPDQLEDLLRWLLMAVEPPGSHIGSAPRREVVTAASDRVAKLAVGGGGGAGQRTHGGDVTFRTVRAFGSECSPRQHIGHYSCQTMVHNIRLC